MHLLYRSNIFWKVPWKSSCVSVSMTFVTASFISSIFSKRQPLSLGNKKSHREQGLNYREGEKLSWCPSWSNSLWQGWSCGLVHCPVGNTTDPIWRVLSSSDGISSWTPLKPQHYNPNPKALANQLGCIDFHNPPTQTPCLAWISNATQKLMLDSCKILQKQSEAFHTFLWHFSKLKKKNS